MITLVEDKEDHKVKRLFKTKSHAAGIKHVVGERYTSRTVSAEELVDLIADGLKVEDITEDDDDAVVSAAESSVPKPDPNANQAAPANTEAGASFNG